MDASTQNPKETDPITPEILKDLVDKFATREASLSNIQVVTICLIGFSGFFTLQ